jgi:putative NIF3 family GTP cyclohydrolase 1 type 2
MIYIQNSLRLGETDMNAQELLNDLIKTSGYYPENTVDKIIIGNPAKQIKRVLTTWICSLRAIQAAIDGGYDAIITHEPTFYMHQNELECLDALEDGTFMKDASLMKKKLLENSGLVVIRVHDSWDTRPVWGIADCWAGALGLSNPVAASADGYQRRYDIAPTMLNTLAKRVANATAPLGEPLVQVIGDGSQMISKICLGPGYASTVQVGRELGCDVNIICDDGSIFWRDIQCAVDMGYPIIRVNHGTAEESGTAMIATYINEHYAEIRADHLRHKPYYQMIGPDMSI